MSFLVPPVPLVSLALACATLLPAPVAGTSLSYRNLTKPEESAAFYRSAGSDWGGRRVHVHVSSSRLFAKPSRIATGPLGGKLHVVENQSVPLVLDPGSVYFRKIQERVDRGDRVCLKGEVRKEPGGGKDRLALWVHSIKRAHDEGSSGTTTKPVKKAKKPKGPPLKL